MDDLQSQNTSVYVDDCNTDYSSASFDTYLQLVLSPLLALFGLLANTVCIVVLTRRPMFSANSFLLILMAVCDCLFLLASLLVVYLSNGALFDSVSLHHFWVHNHQAFLFATYMTTTLSAYLVVFALVERLLASLCRDKTGCCRRLFLRWLCPSVVLVPFVLLAALLNASVFLATRVLRIDCPPDSLRAFVIVSGVHYSGNGRFTAQFTELLVKQWPPMFAALALGVVVVVLARLMRGNSRRFKDASYRSGVVGVLCFLFGLLPLLLMVTDTFFIEYMAYGRLYQFYLILDSCVNLSLMLLPTIKVVAYCLVGPVFRENLLALCGRPPQSQHYELAPLNEQELAPSVAPEVTEK